MKNKKNITLLNITCTVVFFSNISIAADFQTLTGFHKANSADYQEKAQVVSDTEAKCNKIDNLKGNAWNTGEFCWIPGVRVPAVDFAVSAGIREANLKTSQDIFGDGATLGASCFSAGSSAAAANNIGGFCVASDLNNSESDISRFSVANELPAAGMQFLQVTFGDGSTLESEMPMAAECISVGGSAAASSNVGGFCMAADLIGSITDFSRFSVANGSPVVGLQFLQVKFTGGSQLGGSLISTECLSVDGSTATTGASGGFCLASDISTLATAGFGNFSVAHDSPVESMQFLQVMFDGEGMSELPPPSGAGAPIGAECFSVNGSIGATDAANGFCLVSDLIASVTDSSSANMTLANDFPVAGMQFIQATFGVSDSTDGAEPAPGSGAPIGAECISEGGTIAATGNIDGFCLVSDLSTPINGSASFSIANDLPVKTWEFVQVPSEDDESLGSLNNFLGAGTPLGMIISDLVVLPFNIHSQSTTASIFDRQTQYFHISDQTNGMESHSTLYWRSYPNLALWLGR